MIGTSLTHEECWELWEAEKDFQNDYENFEAGLSDGEIRASQDPFYGWAAAEADLYRNKIHLADQFGGAAFLNREVGYIEMEKLAYKEAQKTKDYILEADKDFFAPVDVIASNEIIEEAFNGETLPKGGTPYWQVCVNRINKALDNNKP